LVDDVLTTGATALACARALRAAGAADVWFIALAGSVDGRRGGKSKKMGQCRKMWLKKRLLLPVECSIMFDGCR
jgi:adenine/guanine phosphoribosyltransferase-like PRPP-binding protein